ncbi:hypothetical protein ACEXQE_04905 [Herbiconiux sp. P17]|uniref:hypothetical protein n=1 Tax=Herbiconiux wuyangfengii TaxID=3342794 RepID=UPI0035B79D83
MTVERGAREASETETEEERGALLSALVTEHFVLQSAAGATISESSSRASIYLAALSSGLVAIGFSSQSPSTLIVLAATVFPTVYVLGWFTIIRLIDTTVASVVAQQRIEAIRGYYGSLSRAASRFFPRDDEKAGTLGVRYRARSLLFTIATMISVVNAVLGAAATAVILAIGADAELITSVVAGALVGAASVVIALTYQQRRFRDVQHAPGDLRASTVPIHPDDPLVQ